MENLDKNSLLKELEFYSRLLEKHEALKKEKEAAISKQARIGQQLNKPQHFHPYKIEKNKTNPVCFNQKYLHKKSISNIVDKKMRDRLYYEKQNFNSKYSLSKNKVSNNILPVNKVAINGKSLNSNCSVMNAKSINDSQKSQSESIKIPSVSSDRCGQSTYNTKDFIREVESLTELLKKKTSGNSHKLFNSASKCKIVTRNKQQSHKKDQNLTFQNITFMKEETRFSKTKGLVETSKMPIAVNYANRKNFSINFDNKKKPLQQQSTNFNKFVYKKSNVKPSLNGNTISPLKDNKNTNESKNGFQKIVSRPASRRVIYSDSKIVSRDVCTSGSAGVFQINILFPDTQNLIKKLHTPNKIISSNRKVLKMSPCVGKIKPSMSFKMKSPNAVKAPRIVKLKQTNSRYKKINKGLTAPNPNIRMQVQQSIQHKSSVKRIKKKVNKYKVVNKTLALSLNEKKADVLHSPVGKNKSFSSDCDSFLENLNNSAVDKLEQNLLAISSELTNPLFPEKNKCSNSKVIKPSLTKVSSKLDSKKSRFKKSKSRISKYKIVNLNISAKYSLKDKQSVHVLTPPKRERAVLVRRLFKSKNVIINKNATPTNYSAKMIKTKYLSLNKRKSPSWQKYMYPTSSLHPKVKGSFLATRLHPKQNRFKTNAISTYHSRLIRKANYGCQVHRSKLIYKNSARKLKSKVNNRYNHSPVVFIRGTRYSKNLNGKTLRKLPAKGHLVKSFHRSSSSLIIKTPDLTKASISTNFASRVLHRSINRILTASSKKTLSKINTYCMFYNRFGRCNRGVKCSYIHDPSKIAVCTRFLRGTCKINGCPFSHEVDPGKMAICSFFLVGQCDKENCLYRHEKLTPNAVLCKEFVQGYCHHGRECKKAHILICPKYMQGECDKGSSCAFPHPPQKAKKNIEKEMEDEEPKPTEVLLEKVLRYFQQGGDSLNESGEKSTTNLFVPKQRKLEEQPSFIPLSTSPAAIHKSK